MKIGLYNIDSKIPNIALMKISMYHKAQGDTVNWCLPLEFGMYDKIYASSIFTYSNKEYVIDNMVCGGTGFDVKLALPQEIDDCDQDYSLYPDFKYAIGFLTRGCIRKCPWCIVPEKEGYIRPYRNIEQVAQGRKEVILLDNNVLAHPHGLKQIERIVELGLKVDFNQGLDARLIDDEIAKLLSKVKWLRPIRMACDDESMIRPVVKATEFLRKHNCTPSVYSVYVLVKDIPSALKRVEELRKHNLDPFAQPFRDRDGNEPPKKLKEFARWVNHKAIFKSISWDEYSASKKIVY